MRDTDTPEPGLIPAHAGKTESPREGLTHVVAHPRSRGENFLMLLRLVTCPGSSPLTRGKPPPDATHVWKARLIPAHAGKTTALHDGPCQGTAHPRSRGENNTYAVWLSSTDGSSPLTRGKHRLGLVLPNVGGLIPAHAGKTADLQHGQDRGWAHPRSRGENGIPALSVGKCGGSSPLTRGKLS